MQRLFLWSKNKNNKLVELSFHEFVIVASLYLLFWMLLQSALAILLLFRFVTMFIFAKLILLDFSAFDNVNVSDVIDVSDVDQCIVLLDDVMSARIVVGC